MLSATLAESGDPALWVGPGGYTAQSAVPLVPNTGWHHVCATWTPVGTTGKVFIDGVLTGSNTEMLPPVDSIRTYCYIGKSNWGHGPDPNFNGGMGAIQIYSRALSDQEILQNYNTSKSRYGL